MDMSPLIQQITGMLWYLVPLAIVAAVMRTPGFKGWVGELIVNISATWLLDKSVYHLIKNVTLPTEDGSTQIDHIIVSVYGIFVVETKNMTGWIFGSPQQKTWTQQLYKKRFKFQNPLHQNYKHTKTLEGLLGLSSEQLLSVIVFVGDSTFKTDMPDNVTYGGGYLRFIKSKTEPVLTQAQVDTVIDVIETGRLRPSFKTSREHVAHVEAHVAEKNRQPSCPKCGSGMVIKIARKGQNAGNTFWGCTCFPRCRGTADVMP